MSGPRFPASRSEPMVLPPSWIVPTDARMVKVPRGAVAVAIFLVTNILLAVLLSFLNVESSTAGGVEIAVGAIAVFAYWRWSDPKRREGKEPPMSDLN